MYSEIQSATVTSPADLIFGLADAMRRVAIDDPDVDRIGQDRAEQHHRPRCRSRATAQDGFSVQLFGFD